MFGRSEKNGKTSIKPTKQGLSTGLMGGVGGGWGWVVMVLWGQWPTPAEGEAKGGFMKKWEK